MATAPSSRRLAASRSETVSEFQRARASLSACQLRTVRRVDAATARDQAAPTERASQEKALRRLSKGGMLSRALALASSALVLVYPSTCARPPPSGNDSVSSASCVFPSRYEASCFGATNPGNTDRTLARNRTPPNPSGPSIVARACVVLKLPCATRRSVGTRVVPSTTPESASAAGCAGDGGDTTSR